MYQNVLYETIETYGNFMINYILLRFQDFDVFYKNHIVLCGALNTNRIILITFLDPSI